jgi:hypothetical protein
MEQVGLLPEIDRALARARNAKSLDARRELCDNVYPLVRMLAEMMGGGFVALEKRIATAEAAIGELATMGDSMILPELAGRIDAVLALGLRLCALVEDLDEERLAARVEAISKTARKYQKSVNNLRKELDAVTVDEDEDEDEDDEEDTSPGKPASPIQPAAVPTNGSAKEE